MRSVAIFIALFSLFILSNAQIEVNDRVISNYAQMTFWADEACTAFVGLKGLTDQPQTLQGTSNQPCQLSMRCLYNPTGEGCSLVSNEFTDVQKQYSATITNNIISVNVDGTVTTYTSSGCIQSDLYDKCYVRFFTEQELRLAVQNYQYSSSSIVLPCLSLLIAALLLL